MGRELIALPRGIITFAFGMGVCITYTRAQVAAMLAMGADGVVLGTRLVATPESTLADAKKVCLTQVVLLSSRAASPLLHAGELSTAKGARKSGTAPAAFRSWREARSKRF